jgi:type IV secretion system protein VirB5
MNKTTILCLLIAAFASVNAAADCTTTSPSSDTSGALDAAMAAAPIAAVLSGVGIPTFDIGSSMNFAKTLTNDAKKIIALKSQVDSWNRQLAMISGSRGMGALAAIGAAGGSSGLIPSSWDSILKQVQDSSGTYGALINAVSGKNAVLTNNQLNQKSATDRALLQRVRNLGATQKVMADTALNVAGMQMAEIQQLTVQIDQACDPKTIQDLHAALAAKQMELENTRLKIYAMDQQMQAEQKAIEATAHEYALGFLDTRRPPTVSLLYTGQPNATGAMTQTVTAPMSPSGQTEP